MNETTGENTPPEIPTYAKIMRKGARTISAPSFRAEIEGKENLTRVEELSKKGYAVIILWNHFSGRDSLQILEDLVLKHKFMQNKEVCLPIWEGLYHYAKYPLEPLAHSTRIKLCPVVNQDSFDALGKKHQEQYKKAEKSPSTTPDSLDELKKKQAHERLKLVLRGRKLNRLAFENILENSKKGGITSFAPQTVREEWLKMPTTDKDNKSPAAVSTLVAQYDREGIDKVAFLFVGLGVKNAPNYSKHKVHGFNFLKKYTVHIGATYTKDELKQRAIEKLALEQFLLEHPPTLEQPTPEPTPEQLAEIQNKQTKTRRGIEKVVSEELTKVVPSEYLKPPPQDNKSMLP